MVTRVAIARDELARIVAEMTADPAREVCGLLFGTPDRIVAVEPCPNVAADPSIRFEIDPTRLLAAHRRARAGGPAVIGSYHSHPSGRARPSLRDAADAAPDGSLWLIGAGRRVSAWRAVADGAVHGRFDRVTLHYAAGTVTRHPVKED